MGWKYTMGGFRYSFVFYHILNMQKVLEGGPCSFHKSMLVCHPLSENEDSHMVKLLEVDMWIQVYNVPKGFISENVVKSIGSSMGRYIKPETTYFHGLWNEYVRVGVAMNIEKALKRSINLKRDGKNLTWINFKYEILGSFCFLCGIIGHSEGECNVVYANLEKIIERA